MIIIYALLADNGDGSAGIHWFKDVNEAQDIMDTDIDKWGMNEGYPAEVLTFPDGFDFEACGITFFNES